MLWGTTARGAPRERGWKGLTTAGSTGRIGRPARAGLEGDYLAGMDIASGAPRASGVGRHNPPQRMGAGPGAPRERGWKDQG